MTRASVTPGDVDRKPHTSAETLERGRLRRLQIIDVATDSFIKSGYRGTSLAAIAEEVGVSQAGLLHHFGTKEKLLEAVVRHRSERDAPLVADIFGNGGLGMFDRLPALAEHSAGEAGLAQLFAVLVAENLLPEHPLHTFFVERYRNVRRYIAIALRKGQERNEVRADIDVDAVSTRIVATLDGLQTQWLLDPERIDLVASFAELGTALKQELQA